MNCTQMIKGPKFANCASLAPHQISLWCRGPRPHPLPREVPLAETDAPRDANLELSVVVSGVMGLPTEAANTTPESLGSISAAVKVPPPLSFKPGSPQMGAGAIILRLEYDG